MLRFIINFFRSLFLYAKTTSPLIFDIRRDSDVEYKEHIYSADTRIPVTISEKDIIKVDNLYGIASSNYLISERFDFNAIVPREVESPLIMMNYVAPDAQAGIVDILGSNDIYIVPGINCNPKEKMLKFGIFYLVCDKAFRMPSPTHYLVLLAEFKLPKTLIVTKNMEVKWGEIDTEETNQTYRFIRIIRDVTDGHRIRAMYIRMDEIHNPHVVYLVL